MSVQHFVACGFATFQLLSCASASAASAYIQLSCEVLSPSYRAACKGVTGGDPVSIYGSTSRNPSEITSFVEAQARSSAGQLGVQVTARFDPPGDAQYEARSFAYASYIDLTRVLSPLPAGSVASVLLSGSADYYAETTLPSLYGQFDFATYELHLDWNTLYKSYDRFGQPLDTVTFGASYAAYTSNGVFLERGTITNHKPLIIQSGGWVQLSATMSASARLFGKDEQDDNDLTVGATMQSMNSLHLYFDGPPGYTFIGDTGYVYPASPIPEPAALWLLVSGLALVARFARKQRSRS